RRGGDYDAIAPGDQARWKIKPFGEKMAFVVNAIAVRIFQHANAAAGLAFVIHAHWVIGHFDNPQFSRSVPIDGDGIEDEWFGGDKFGAIAGRGVDFFE